MACISRGNLASPVMAHPMICNHGPALDWIVMREEWKLRQGRNPVQTTFGEIGIHQGSINKITASSFSGGEEVVQRGMESEHRAIVEVLRY